MDTKVSKKFLIRKYKNYKHLLVSLKQVIAYGYPARKLKVIGITGTDGKTTTGHLLYEILKEGGLKVALISTLGAFIDNKTIDTGFHVTTPDARFLQPLIKKIVDKNIKYLILEVTSHGLDQYRTLGCNFWGAILTNVTHEHLDYHKTFNNYRKAKGRLFAGVKLAVINKDDPSFIFFKSLLKNGSKVISYSIQKSASLSVSEIKLERGKMRFLINDGGKKIVAKTNLVGDYNVSNILAAAAMSRSLGVGWTSIVKTLQRFRGVEGRMDSVDLGQSFSVIIDFAHTPNALRNVLITLNKIKDSRTRLIAVFGCAGERDKGKRPLMGKISARYADLSLFTAEDPRGEDVKDIISQMVAGARGGGAEELTLKESGNFSKKSAKHLFVIIPDRRTAIHFAIKNMVAKGDVLVICGKGHEKSMAYGDKEYPWSDVEVAKKALLGRKGL